MDLCFPNARLLVCNNLLLASDDCYLATVDAAIELGLLPPDFAFQQEEVSGLDQEKCGAVRAAFQILEHSLSVKAGQAVTDLNQKNKIWRSITGKIEGYKKDKIPGYTQIKTIDKAACLQMAPVVIDILLQHLVSNL